MSSQIILGVVASAFILILVGCSSFLIGLNYQASLAEQVFLFLEKRKSKDSEDYLLLLEVMESQLLRAMCLANYLELKLENDPMIKKEDFGKLRLLTNLLDGLKSDKLQTFTDLYKDSILYNKYLNQKKEDDLHFYLNNSENIEKICKSDFFIQLGIIYQDSFLEVFANEQMMKLIDQFCKMEKALELNENDLYAKRNLAIIKDKIRRNVNLIKNELKRQGSLKYQVD